MLELACPVWKVCACHTYQGTSNKKQSDLARVWVDNVECRTPDFTFQRMNSKDYLKVHLHTFTICRCLNHLDFFCLIPECVARVPVSLWGSGGRGCVRSTLRSRSQPSATVRNRPQPFVWGPYGRAYGKFCRRDHFWRFQTSGCFVSRGRRGTSWHSATFCNVSKVVLCGRRNTFATFSEDVLHFSWQAQHFGRVHRHFSWQAQHFRRVVLRVYCKSHWQGCVKWRQGANSVAGVAFGAMCWKLTEASHETSILRLQIFRF